MKKLLIIGSNTIHTYNYIELIEDYFDEILLLTNLKNDKYNVNTIEINFRLGLNIFSSAKKIKQITEEFNPSIIHIQQANSYAFISLLGLKKINIPKVLTAWGSDVLVNPQKSIILKKILEYNLKNVDVATSDSLYMSSVMKGYCPQLDIEIAHLGIVLHEYTGEKENMVYSNRQHKPLYNIDKVIYTFKEFVKLNPDWKLVIGAIGTETEFLKKLVKKEGLENNVEFIGWVDTERNNEMYQKSKIYISIPSSDASAISLLEAISNNCICFVSNLPANSEHVLTGINGFIEADLDQIDLEKYQKLDNDILKKVNNIRKEEYLKARNKNIFLNIYNTLLKEKTDEKYTIS